MTQALTTENRYLSDFHVLERALSADRASWFSPLREHALARFMQLGFPTARRGNEKWKYTSVMPIASTDFLYPVDASQDGIKADDIGRSAPWSDSWVNLVFIDGRYSQALSTPPSAADGIEVANLAEAMIHRREVVEMHLARHARFENEAFAALNTAFISQGAFVHVPEGVRSKAVVHLVFVSTDSGQPSVSYPRALILVGKGSNLTVIETYVGLSNNRYFTNAVTEIVVEESAQVDHYRLLLESPQSFHVGTTRVFQDRDSTLSSAFFAMGGTALARNNMHVLLDGPGSSSLLKGLYVTREGQRIDNFINIDHAKPHTNSRLYYKGILDGNSQAVFGGTVMVRKNAQKVDAKQSDKNLLLSEEAEINSKPALLIFNDDVKCGHGATAGHIDEDTLFYMRSRGLDIKTAGTFIIRGFASEIIDTAQPEPLRNYLDSWILGAIASQALGQNFASVQALPETAPRFRYGGKP